MLIIKQKSISYTSIKLNIQISKVVKHNFTWEGKALGPQAKTLWKDDIFEDNIAQN